MKALLLAAAALIATPAAAQTIAVTGGTLVIGDGSAPIEGGTVVIRNGRVVAAGRSVAVPADAERIDATGKWVTPGIVSGFTRVGLVGVDAVDGSNDIVANTSPFTASIDVAPAINPDVAAIAVNRAAGVTRAVVAPAPGSAMFAGQGAVIDTGADTDAVTRPRAFQFVAFGESGAREAGGSRAAAHAYFRNALAEARDYGRNPAAYDGRSKDSMLLRRDAAALLPVIDGRMKLLVHAESAPDILATIDLKREFPGLDLVIVGATEGWRVARQLAAARVAVLASALNDLPDSFEQIAATQSNIGRMVAAGVTVGLGMINDNEERQGMHVLQYAGNLVALTRIPGASGLDWNKAFAAISSQPAEAVGMGGEIGSLRPGRRGDVVIWGGDPLEVTTAAEAVWIDGIRQPLSTRQTRLRDRYRTPQESERPKAYDR